MNFRHTLLLVDDSENDRLLMHEAFRRAGFHGHLHEAGDGDEAIAYLEGEGKFADRTAYPMPALLLLDLNMPRKDGFEVLRWVRAHSGLRRLAVIVLSASMRTEDIERCFDLGANSFLVKPSSLPELTELMRALHGWLRFNHFPPLAAAAAQGTSVSERA